MLLRVLIRRYYRAKRRRVLRSAIAEATDVRIIIGSSGLNQPGWISTEAEDLNLLCEQDWQDALGSRKADAILAEHVWEHLTLEEGMRAFKTCFDRLRPGGHLRVAVPDGRFPDPDYIDSVKPGGTGPGADDHKVLYDAALLSEGMSMAGFKVRLLEYFDEYGRFHEDDWDPSSGRIERSKRFDPRNQGQGLRYTSIIADGLKP